MDNKYIVRQERLKKSLGFGDNWEEKMRKYLVDCTQWTRDCIDSYYFGKDVASPCTEKINYALTARYTAKRVVKERAFKEWNKNSQ